MKLYAEWKGPQDPERGGAARSQRLEDVAGECGLPVPSVRHRALPDAQLAGELLRYLAQGRDNV